MDGPASYRPVVIPPELASRTVSYSLRPPSPPRLHVPALPGMAKIELPTNGSPDGFGLSTEEIVSITHAQNLNIDNMSKWRYENRRAAQQILPFLYLGPYSAVKDRTFLRDQEISLLLVVRDLKWAQARFLSGDKVAQELGIASTALDLQSPTEIIAAFPRFISIVNEHLLAVHRRSAAAAVNGQASPLTRPNVLVFCESGNDRSACCVVAYIMAMYGLDVVSALQFTHSKRLSISLTDDLTMLLTSFGDILRARRDVRMAPRQPPPTGRLDGVSVPASSSGQRCKRDATEMDFGEDMDAEKYMDQERFLDRPDFVPFSDTADI